MGTIQSVALLANAITPVDYSKTRKKYPPAGDWALPGVSNKITPTQNLPKAANMKKSENAAPVKCGAVKLLTPEAVT